MNLGKFHPQSILTTYLHKIHLYIVFPFPSWTSKLMFPDQNSACIHLSHPQIYHNIIIQWWRWWWFNSLLFMCSVNSYNKKANERKIISAERRMQDMPFFIVWRNYDRTTKSANNRICRTIKKKTGNIITGMALTIFKKRF
jgi:hypothetical protein